MIGLRSVSLRISALVCTALLVPGDVPLVAQLADASSQQNAPGSKPIPPEQLDSLVAPLALYPDPLLAQVLAASTYPLELVQLEQWLQKHKDLKDKALEDAVLKENWDPSVQAMAALPDVVKRLVDDIKWTDELGNAFLAQQSDVMDAIQRMRAKAKESGKLQSNEQIKVETKVVESKSVVVIQQANPQVVYVPSYNPVVVWGAAPYPLYPYPPIAYPPVGYVAAGMALSFGVGVAMGAFWSGGWGWNCGWGGNNTIHINNNNNFNRNNFNRTNIGNANRGGSNIGSGNRATQWQHNPQHRGGAPYGDRATANRFGGTARGDSLSNRQVSARQNAGQLGGSANRGFGSSGVSSFRSGAGSGPGSAGANLGGGGDRIGNRQVSSGASNRGAGAFSSGGGAAAARSNSMRGASSLGAGGGGGMRGAAGRRR